jgi:hypothetical protein
MKLSVKVDPYFNLDAKEVMLLVAGGMIEKWEGLMHFKVESIIRDLVYEDEGFLALDYLEQKKKIEEVAKRLVPQKNTLPLSDNMSAYGLRQNNRASGRSTAGDNSEEQGDGE